MTEPIPFKPADPVQRKELADEAKWLLDNKAFTAAVLALRKRWFAEMMASTDEVVDRRLKAQILALEAIPQELQILVNDEKMAQARHK
jgi:hypothetical protein